MAVVKRPHIWAYTILTVAFLLGGGLWLHEVDARTDFQKEFCESRRDAWNKVSRAVVLIGLEHNRQDIVDIVRAIPPLEC